MRAGAMFADHELIRIVISDQWLKEGKQEYKGRTDVEATTIDQASVLEFISRRVKGG